MHRRGIYNAWGTRGLIAYGVGFVSMLPFFVLPELYMGPVATYLWLSRAFDLVYEAQAITASEASLKIAMR